MVQGGSPSAHSEKVLIIMSNAHAAEVRTAIDDHIQEAGSAASASEARIHRAIVTALQTVYNRPDGWYDAELRAELARKVRPQLSRTESARVMQGVYAVIPLREETTAIKNKRQTRREKPGRK